MKNYFGFVRDHSASMHPLTAAAKRDYNANINCIREEAIASKLDTIVSVMQCGIGRPTKNEFEIINSSVTKLKPMQSYSATGTCTPLYDAVMQLIESLEATPDINNPDVAYLVFVTTDGEENASYVTAKELSNKIQELQKTDRWTFVFRVPRGSRNSVISRLQLPAGNVIEWDQTDRGVAEATQATTSAFKTFYQKRQAGEKSSKTFYADLSAVSKAQVKNSLTDITGEVSVFDVPEAMKIKDFFLDTTGTFQQGCGFYELTKREKEVQDYKKIVLYDIRARKYYGGDDARGLLGLPETGSGVSVALAPGDHAGYRIFIQSTSVNRKLLAETKVLYWG